MTIRQFVGVFSFQFSVFGVQWHTGFVPCASGPMTVRLDTNLADPCPVPHPAFVRLWRKKAGWGTIDSWNSRASHSVWLPSRQARMESFETSFYSVFGTSCTTSKLWVLLIMPVPVTYTTRSPASNMPRSTAHFVTSSNSAAGLSRFCTL